MTYREDFTLPAELLEQVQEQGLDVLPELIRLLINTAMRVERTEHLKAAPYQHNPERKGHANGYEPKTMRTRVGEITFAIPQVREGGFYPQALERGLRSERALTLSLAEMYVQGVSTRKVKAITEQLCGLNVDDHLLEADRAAQDWAMWWGTIAYRIRPLLKASYIISHSLGKALGSVPFGHHLFSLCVHLLTVVLAYRVARDLSTSIFPGVTGASGRATAAGCAAVLALHPLATEAITYISGRSVALATLFVLASMALHMRGSRETAAGARAPWMGGAAACYIAAVLTRETMIVLPAVLVFYEWSRADRPETPFSAARLISCFQRTFGYWALAAAASLWLLMHDGYGNLIAVSRVIVQGRVAEPSLLPALEYFAARVPLLAPLSIDPDLSPQDVSWLRRLVGTLPAAFQLAGDQIAARLAWRKRHPGDRRRRYQTTHASLA